MAKRSPFLSFEDFERRKELSFRGFFLGGLAGECYRKLDVFILCMQAHPRKFPKLVEKLREYKDNDSPEYRRMLYEAYKLMYPYAKSNKDLFE